MGITHLSGLEVAGVPTMGMAGLPLTTGNVWFVNPATGSDGNTGAADNPLATLYQALAKATAGNNDVVVLVGDGATAGTARLSKALAQTIDPAATSGTLKWNKAATHLVGMTAPSASAQRARIAPPSGVYTQATFGSGDLVEVSAQGCIFANFSLFHGFSTGGTNQVCWTDTGGRNFYSCVDFGGIGDTASAADTGARSLKIGGGGVGENYFYNCVIGLDTVSRSVANASLEFTGATPRNRFVECLFPFDASNAAVLGILGTGNGCVDRWQSFERCVFINAMSSGATAMTEIASFTTASPGGLLLFKDCTSVNGSGTNWGDTNALANSWVDGGPPTAGTTGLAVNPS